MGCRSQTGHAILTPVPPGKVTCGASAARARWRATVALHGGHEAGTDLNQRERDLLTRLARQAEIAYAYLETETLRRRLAALEARLAETAGAGDAR